MAELVHRHQNYESDHELKGFNKNFHLSNYTFIALIRAVARARASLFTAT